MRRIVCCLALLALALSLPRHARASADVAERPPNFVFILADDLGCDHFFGFIDANAAHQHYPKKLWLDREEKAVEGYANVLFTDDALGFLKANREKPFFLYLAYTIPHFGIQAPPEDVAAFKGK